MRPNNTCFLGGDSGGSKTEWRLLSEEGALLHRFVQEGMAAAQAGILPCARLAKEASEVLDSTPRLVYLSLGGPNVDEVRGAISAAFPQSEVIVERESNGALVFAFSEMFGIHGTVMAGTGVTSVGFDSAGWKYVEGWGPAYGDRASGGGIGTAALKLFLQGIDGLADSGGLSSLFEEQTQGLDISSYKDRMELKRRITLLSRRDLAAMAPKIMALAASGDSAAGQLIEETAEQLGAIAAAIAPSKGRILWLGGLFRLGASFVEQCNAALSRRRPDCTGVYDERISLGKLAAARSLQLGGRQLSEARMKEIIYGD